MGRVVAMLPQHHRPKSRAVPPVRRWGSIWQSRRRASWAEELVGP
jgi:hypothetical protein